MLNSQDITDDLLYNNISDFCQSKAITAKSLRLDIQSNLLHEFDIDHPLTGENIQCFQIDVNHKNSSLYSNYLNERFNQYTALESVVKSFDRFFNSKQNDDCFTIDNAYYFDEHDNLQSIKLFQFIELQYGDDHMCLVEDKETHSRSYDNLLFDYYKTYFCPDLPHELDKPFLDMSADELDVLRMIII